MPVSGSRIGLALAILSAIGSAPDGTLLRLLQVLHVANLAIVAWKFLLLAIIQAGFVAYRHGCGGRLVKALRAGWPHVVVGFAFQLGGTLSTVAMLSGCIANALFLYYLSPVWGLALGCALLGEPLMHRIAAVVAAVIAVLFISIPTIVAPPQEGAPVGAASLAADGAALVAGMSVAGYLVTCRHAATRGSPAPMVCANLARALLVSAGTFAAGLASGTPLGLDGAQAAVVVADAAGIAIFQIAGMLAAQHIPAADLSTVQLLDLVLGPAIAFAVHGEAPTSWALAGGALLLCVLVVVARGLLAPPKEQSSTSKVSRNVRKLKQQELEASCEALRGVDVEDSESAIA